MNKIEIRKQAAKIKNVLISSDTQCVICDHNFSVFLNQHHIVPVSRDGDNEIENLIFLCPNCHALIHKGISYMERFKKLGYDDTKTHKMMRGLKNHIEELFPKEKQDLFWKTMYSYINS